MGNKTTKTQYRSKPSDYDIEGQDFDDGEKENLNDENDETVNARREEERGKRASDFQKRKCVKFVIPTDSQKKPDICAHCKKDMSVHREEIELEVNSLTRPKLYEQCTEVETTDAYGELLFSSANCKKAKYIKVKSDTPIEEMTRYLFSETGFNLQPPKLILSVTGGARNFAIEEDIKFALKYGLMKIASSTDAWIISGGTNFGVMRLVGDAVAEEFQNEELPVIGIASWGVVYDESLNIPTSETSEETSNHYVVRYFSERNQSMVAINPNHSHFIFVDDGSYKEFGVEIDFRTNLEAHVQSLGNVDMNNNNRMAPDKIPMVLIVVQGGPNTLLTIDNALKSDIPVILLANSGGAADMVIKARERSITSSNLNNLDNRLRQLVESPGFEVYRSNAEVKNNTIRLLTNIVNESYKRLLNVFEMRTAGSGKNIEPTVLEALSKAETKIYKRIQFAIKWDRFDIAKSEMKKHASTSDKLSNIELEKLLELALIENKPKFVALILEHEVNLVEFSTVRRLKDLYNNELKQRKVKNEEPFLLYLEKKKGLSKSRQGNGKIDNVKSITPKLIRKFLKSLFSTFEPNKFLPGNFDDENLENRFAEQELNLFLWCILSNRIEIGKIFWRLGKYQICYALMASKILKCFASHLPDLNEELSKSAEEFEDLAIGVVRVFDENTRDTINDTLIIRYLEPVKMDCLEFAVECDSEKFLSQPSIQKVMDNLWYGTTYDNTELTDFEKSLRNCQENLNKKQNYIFNKENISKLTKNQNPWERFINFMNIPFVHFILHFIFYILFLTLFSYVLLFKYKYPDNEDKEKSGKNDSIIEESVNDNDTNQSSMPLKSKAITFNKVIPNLNISGYEIILLIWIFSLLFEEIRQFLNVSKFSQTSWKYKLQNYMQDQWNLLDVLGCLLFIIGFVLKAISLKASEDVFIWARIILSIDLVIWFIRALHFCLLLETLGPKLVMIRKMVDDLKYFMVIVSTFVLAFGISLQAIMDSQSSFEAKTLLDVLTVAYWPIYGEITLLEKVNEEKCDPEEGVCADSHSKTVSYFLLMIYLLIANVLLLNILIAMFSSTFESIQNNSALIWKNQRYHLISEYTDSPILPAPFNLINYIWFGIKKIKYKLTQDSQEPSDEQIDLKDFTKQSHSLDALMDYEQKCTQKLLKEVRSKMNEIEENKVAVLNDKIEALEKQLQELTQTTKNQHNELIESRRPLSEPM